MATTPSQPSTSGPPQTTPATVPEATTTATTTATTAATTVATTATSDSPQAGGTTTAQPTTAEPATTTTTTPALASTSTAATELPAAQATTTPATAVLPETAPLPQTTLSDVLPASHWAQIPHVEEEDEFDDNDSAYGDDNASSTASLSASILEYRTVHGRTYHSERGNAQSWNPNDAQHDESMDILHHVSTLMQDGRLTMAHIDQNVQKVLDVGCGTGIWAIDFADQYPHAEVIGVDISPSQPQWIPPNLKFEIDDVTQPWTYAPNSFDYIHMRWLIGAIPNWYTLFREVYQTLKPGGIFESKESSAIIQSDDGTVPYGSAMDQWGRVFSEAGRKFGRTFQPVEDNIQLMAMEAAGFVDIKVYNMKTTLGPWAADAKHKEIGQYARLALEQDIEGFIMYMWTTVLGWTREEIAVYAAHLRRELRSPHCHAYYPQRVVVGRKP
ncbi:S-adenosyl-L-methionine-dependent methyltransferase [Xylaria telfairii]|nr:S-adenosyl-L-methionine-dependent methyltransferase [Xylaria telfairii]